MGSNVVTCTFSLLNTESTTRSLVFQWATFLIDDQGNQYEQSTPTQYSLSVDYPGMGRQIYPGVPVNLTLLARNVPDAARTMNASLGYEFHDSPNQIGNGRVLIRSIPIQRR